MPRGFKRAVVMIDSKGEIKETFASIREASDNVPGMCPQQVRYNCNGKAKTFYHGYTFAYADTPECIERNAQRIKEWSVGIETT